VVAAERAASARGRAAFARDKGAVIELTGAGEPRPEMMMSEARSGYGDGEGSLGEQLVLAVREDRYDGTLRDPLGCSSLSES